MIFKNQDPNFQENSFLDFLKWQLQKIKLFNKIKIFNYLVSNYKISGNNNQDTFLINDQYKISDNNNQDILPLSRIYNNLEVTYVGHVTFLIQTDGLNILTDPVWSDRASPFSFIGPRRIQKPGIKFENLPQIDIVLISHNHYDHMDIETLKKLYKRNDPLIIAPLGNEKIIKKYISNVRIVTLNWSENHNYQNVNIYLETAQHWSARGLFDKNKALWGTFIIKTTFGDICFIGDSGYNDYIFKTISQKHSNIILSLIPIGAYKPRWFMKNVHMDPRESLLTHMDLKSKNSIASHFDVFPLADDCYGEAVNELKMQRQELNISENEFIIPKVGSTYSF